MPNAIAPSPHRTQPHGKGGNPQAPQTPAHAPAAPAPEPADNTAYKISAEDEADLLRRFKGINKDYAELAAHQIDPNQSAFVQSIYLSGQTNEMTRLSIKHQSALAPLIVNEMTSDQEAIDAINKNTGDVLDPTAGDAARLDARKGKDGKAVWDDRDAKAHAVNGALKKARWGRAVTGTTTGGDLKTLKSALSAQLMDTRAKSSALSDEMRSRQTQADSKNTEMATAVKSHQQTAARVLQNF